MRRIVVVLSLLLSSHALGHRVREIDLVADTPGVARFTDPNLVNPWGLVVGRDRLRTADNHTGVATLYDDDGRPLREVITIPPPSGGTGPSAPTGMVLNRSDDFVIRHGRRHAPAELIFVTEDGTISGWNREVDRDEAILEVDNSAAQAVYKGVAIARRGREHAIYATNFHAGVVEIYDESFGLVGTFTDPSPPPGRGTFAPFGIRNIGGFLFVTFAVQAPGAMDDLPGPGNGFVDIFDADGRLLRRFATEGVLNSPWGLELAPFGFGRGPVLLVGNFGDGRINLFDFVSGASLGPLEDLRGQPLVIDGLWSISFEGDPAHDVFRGGPLYFTAGPNGEENGLLGVLVR